MKKIVIAVFAVATAAVAAQAQGLGTVRDINYFGQEYLQAQVKQAEAATKKVEAEIQRQHIAHLRAEQKKQQAAQQQAKSSEQAAQNQTPSYYYGREGKLLALSDRTAQVINGGATDQQSAGEKTAQSTAKQAAPAKKAAKKKVSLWRYLLPGGRLPGESWEDYNTRMSSPASQPFK